MFVINQQTVCPGQSSGVIVPALSKRHIRMVFLPPLKEVTMFVMWGQSTFGCWMDNIRHKLCLQTDKNLENDLFILSTLGKLHGDVDETVCRK
jgi:hypothetical protein